MNHMESNFTVDGIIAPSLPADASKLDLMIELKNNAILSREFLNYFIAISEEDNGTDGKYARII